MRKATNTAQPRARDSMFACSAWVRHLPPVLANTPNYDDSPQRLDRKTPASLDVYAVPLSLLSSRGTPSVAACMQTEFARGEKMKTICRGRLTELAANRMFIG